MPLFFWDPTYVIILPAIVLALCAQLRIQFVYGRYSRVPTFSKLTGAQVAREILRRNGLWGVRVERAAGGILSDDYDPHKRVLRLSRDIHDGMSVAAVGVAAHETGHAIQHARNYRPLAMRSVLVPMAMLGSWLAWPLVALGFLFQAQPLIETGILVFSAAVAFTIVSLPVEFDASGRAVRNLRETGLATPGELGGVQSVLNAAALTYVAAAATAVLQLVRLVLLAQTSRRA
jgi:uncharacterized protein